MLFVSHDRYFLDQVADALFLFREDGVQYYPFGYSHYVTRRNAALGEDIAALIAAEDQALVAELHAVPRGERHRLRELGTEEAHLDWKLRLSREPMEEAAACYEHLYEQWLWAKQPDEELGRQLAMAEQRWSEACIAYYLIASEDPHLMEKA